LWLFFVLLSPRAWFLWCFLFKGLGFVGLSVFFFPLRNSFQESSICFSHTHAAHLASPAHSQAIAGIVFSAATALMFWFWMPHAEGGGASYEFKQVATGGGSTASAPTFAGSYANEPSKSTDYQGFGSSSSM